MVNANRPFIANKASLVIRSLVMNNLNSPKSPQVIRLVSSADGPVHYSADTKKVGVTSLSKNLHEDLLNDKMIDEFSSDLKQSGCTSLNLKGNRLKSLDSRLVSGLELLTDLDLSQNQLESLNEQLLGTCKNLKKLNLENAFHADAKFSLTFLSSSARTLRELSLTLPEGPVDFSVFSKMSNLQKLKIRGAASLDSNREPLTLTSKDISLISAHKLEHLTLSHFNLPAIDKDMLKDFKKLKFLYLPSCNISHIDPDAFKA